MKQLTKSEAVAAHRKMWNWIKEETKKRKRKVEKFEYFYEMNIPLEDRPHSNCYCCEFKKQHGCFCGRCPIDWGIDRYDGGRTPCLIGLFGEWYDCRGNDWTRAAELAGKIAELPEREEKK